MLTNMALIHINLGLFGNYKDTTRYSFDSVNQIVVGEASNGEKQLEVYHPGGQDDFAFQSGNKRVLKVWELAISDQMSGHGSNFDAAYYRDLLELAENEKDDKKADAGEADISFLGDVAKSVLSSGDISVNGVIRGVKRTAKKQAFSKAAAGVMGGLGIEGNCSAGDSKRREILSFQQHMEQARMERMMFDEEQENSSEPESVKVDESQNALALQEQLELLKQLKELLDMGAITQEEFDKKKQQIMAL
ncbi:SHOCT domain-containing protein [Atopobiaceae bacterium Sow4_H2]